MMLLQGIWLKAIAYHILIFAFLFVPGWTGETVCLAGDSAGANLMIATALRAGSYGIKAPDGIVAIYSAVMIRYAPSPSRILGLMDPLLPVGILARCLAGIHFTLRPPMSGRYTFYIMPPDVWQVYILHYAPRCLAGIHFTLRPLTLLLVWILARCLAGIHFTLRPLTVTDGLTAVCWDIGSMPGRYVFYITPPHTAACWDIGSLSGR